MNPKADIPDQVFLIYPNTYIRHCIHLGERDFLLVLAIAKELLFLIKHYYWKANSTFCLLETSPTAFPHPSTAITRIVTYVHVSDIDLREIQCKHSKSNAA